MLAKRLIKSNDAGGGGACTNTVDLYNPFPDGGGVALYQLNGDATDVSGNYNGTASNVTYGTGVFGQAGVFNGTSSKVSTSAYGLSGNASYSASLWFNLGDTSGDQVLYSFGNNVAYAASAIYIRNNNQIYHANNANADFFTSVPTLSAGVWYHFVLTYSSGYLTAYINNSSIGRIPISQGALSISGNLGRIGCDVYDNNFLNGSIDQVRIFNRALRPYEVEALYTEEYCTPTIVPSEHFNTVLYSGNSSTQNVTSVGFAPDLVWIKERTGTDHHRLQDTVRGAGYRLYSSTTSAEGYTNDSITSFNADGFSLGGSFGVNESGQDYVAWNFKAGGAAVTNTDGTITSQVSANTDAGFSIVTWTGTGASGSTRGHGLGVAPDVVIMKMRNAAGEWFVYHSAIGVSQVLRLYDTIASTTQGDIIWNSTAPTSTVFSTGSYLNVAGGYDYVAYCFAEVEGFSNFGSYVGTGASGNTIVTGFEPAMVIAKMTSAADSWRMYDNKRIGSEGNGVLYPNSSTSEGNVNHITFLENGFVWNSDNANSINQDFIYMAFAADPTTIEPSLEDSFNTVLYTGNANQQNISGVGFQPDLVWVKSRSNPQSHVLGDSVRGIRRALFSDLTNAESVSGGDNFIYSFNTDGFSVGGGDYGVNNNGYTYVAWNWKAAELPAINSNGSITSVVSANPAAGFSIVSWTGNGNTASIGHGLSSAPDMIILKNRTDVDSWEIHHKSITPITYSITFTSSAARLSNYFTAKDLTTFSVGGYNRSNGLNDSMIAYCFAEVAGFSKFGSYTGTGASGNTVTLGFEPAFVMTKNIDDNAAFDRWYIQDSVRGGGKLLYADESFAEGNFTSIQFDANGFTINTTDTGINEIGKTYIYMAFANQF
jgi:hypothetical protein